MTAFSAVGSRRLSLGHASFERMGRLYREALSRAAPCGEPRIVTPPGRHPFPVSLPE